MLPRTECGLGTFPTVRVPMIKANATGIGLFKMVFSSMSFFLVDAATAELHVWDYWL